jgi:hypothetical protein
MWRRLDQVAGQKVASRADLLTVLSDVQAILVRASLSSQTRSSHISDVSLDTAVPQYTEQGLVTEVENCHCPPGYRGTSCEVSYLYCPFHYLNYNYGNQKLIFAI